MESLNRERCETMRATTRREATERAGVEAKPQEISTLKLEAGSGKLTRSGAGADLLAQFKSAGYAHNASAGSKPFWARPRRFLKRLRPRALPSGRRSTLTGAPLSPN